MEYNIEENKEGQQQIFQNAEAMPPMQQEAAPPFGTGLFIQKQSTSSWIRSCLIVLAIIAFVIVFFIYGGRVFEYFNLSNIYNFIISIVVTIVLYILVIIAVGIFTTYPKDLLGLMNNRGNLPM